MNLLSRRSVLAIAAVVDVALHSRATPVGAKARCARHHYPSSPGDIIPSALRQIIRACAGREAAMGTARERQRISVGEIVRTAMSLETPPDKDVWRTPRLTAISTRMVDLKAVPQGRRNFITRYRCDREDEQM